ncbi:MAG TPA: hypothetical protein PKW33_03510 [Anaerolineaceae bacterium]|nr:hypothetical protein [Anaerolineaceae bacterium]HPN50629.1 hypothetical protein [Anaerolineaceae bacterium]
MDWLAQNWYWVVGAVILIIIVAVSINRTRKPKVSDQQVGEMVVALVNAFDEILESFLSTKYSKADRKKIAIGMVAIMATDKISLDDMKRNPDMVINIAAKSAAMLTQQGEIHQL